MHGIENLLDEAGIPVALERRGEPRRLPPVVGRGAYRVVRDALACRGAPASVAIEFMPGALAVQVDADGERLRPRRGRRRWRPRSAAGSGRCRGRAGSGCGRGCRPKASRRVP